MNPFATVVCVNTDADEYTEHEMPRWQLWWYRLFGNAYAKRWREKRQSLRVPGRASQCDGCGNWDVWGEPGSRCCLTCGRHERPASSVY